MAIGFSGAATVGRVSETDITDIGIKGPVSSPQGLIDLPVHCAGTAFREAAVYAMIFLVQSCGGRTADED